MRSSEFSWPVYRRSWRTSSLWNAQDAETPSGLPRPESKSIFFLPDERPPQLYYTNSSLSQFTRGTDVELDDFVKLRPGIYLNGDIINGYISLINEAQQEGVIVCSTYMYKCTVQNNGKAMRRMVCIYLLPRLHVLKPSFRLHVQLGASKSENDEPLRNLIQRHKKIILPVNWNSHWVTVLLDVEKKEAVFMDSLMSYTGKSGTTKMFKVRNLSS